MRQQATPTATLERTVYRAGKSSVSGESFSDAEAPAVSRSNITGQTAHGKHVCETGGTAT
ncbi:hypothetical protein DB35_02460 [Streptomyces abyssalis]|uniref:Uncharacterized protein n=1 Tax=Streptomyces abyssalis TaxID=933944 RepID=A0A1E7JPL9_9ACTN|nr:hypothetical protein [Streptomyces abyssalis]OEU90184.1 hypothetical protein AN215_11610 [Streptomyces abyssalis]OEU94918.1 hypothetical protein DB35_02460 [Streptomyces abyssalis]OEV26982.1 hypothetical protein AN219_23910 [Streptomyces nanshensis]